MELRDWLRFAEERLTRANFESPKTEAWMLAAHVLRVDRSWLLAHPETEFNDLAGETLLQRREAGEPLAYILGWREFYGRRFGVDRSVLIPRHETEVLIDAALSLDQTAIGEVLDVGVGSGVLAITLKLERPNWNVTGVDLSPEALATASANARFLKAQVRLINSDRFQALLGESFDLIVSNPPYIGRDETLPAEIAEFEPALALFAEEGGLAFYRQLAREAIACLNDDGLLLMEVGDRQSAAVRQIFLDAGWTPAGVWKDLLGTERVLGFTYLYL
jgi:release factor glutamine methyltransferase